MLSLDNKQCIVKEIGMSTGIYQIHMALSKKMEFYGRSRIPKSHPGPGVQSLIMDLLHFPFPGSSYFYYFFHLIFAEKANNFDQKTWFGAQFNEM